MMTPDKDYGQLVSSHIFMYRPKFGGDFEILGPEEIKTKYGIQSPEQVIDILGLMGDSSDNIPGCPGVGEKTAVKLIADFGGIENLLANTDRLKGALKTKVEENRSQIEFSKFLATIKTDVPLTFDEKSLRREPVNSEKLRPIFEELEFRNLTERVLGNQPTTPTPKKTVQPSLFDNVPETEQTDDSAPQSNLANIASIPHTYHLTDTPEKMWDLAALLSCASAFAFDTETTGVDPMNVELVGLSFALKEHEAYYIPIPEDQEKAREIVNIFKSALENPKSLKIGQNIKYDYIVLHNYGIHVKGDFFDTMVAHYLLQPEQYHNMDYLANVYLGYEPCVHRKTHRSEREKTTFHATSPGRASLRICRRRRRCYLATEKPARKRVEDRKNGKALLRHRNAIDKSSRRHGNNRSQCRYNRIKKLLGYPHPTHERVGTRDFPIGRRYIQCKFGTTGRRSPFRTIENR